MEKNEFGTAVIGCAAFLITIGFKMVRLEPTDKPRQRKFIFANVIPEKVEPFYRTPQQAIIAYENKEVNPAILELCQPSELGWVKTKLYADYEPAEPTAAPYGRA